MDSRPASQSFRDPDGSVVVTGDRVLRGVRAKAASNLWKALASDAVRRLVTQGAFIESRLLDGPALAEARTMLGSGKREDLGDMVVLEHPRVGFPSFPYEWCPEMLHAAGRLTLDIASGLHKSGLGLKDATPYNVLFRGPQPVFIDAASLEARETGDPTWLPYAQFVRTFLLPLLVSKHCRMSLRQVFLAHRDGLEPEAVYALLGIGRRLRPPFLFTVSVPTWLAGRAGGQPTIYKRRSEAPDKAAFILASTIGHLRRQLERAAPVSVSSTWSDYMETKSYREDGFDTKERFVKAALDAGKASVVLDIGCNTGHFSEIAARHGAEVVALDSDPVCVGKTFQRAVATSLPILPLVADISRPSPAMGWRTSEQSSLVDRLAGRFDLVLMLAVLHHLLVTERIPLREILRLAADLTKDLLVLEYVGPSDDMFKKLVRGRDDLYSHVNVGWFETACREFFEIVDVKSLEPLDRRLYLLRRRLR